MDRQEQRQSDNIEDSSSAAGRTGVTVSDRAVIDGFRAGDESAIRALYERYGGAIFSVARSVTNDRELAAEVVQQTFTKAWRSASSFDPDRDIAPWLYSIARRTAIDVIRHERRPTIGGHSPEVEVGTAGPSFERTWEIHEVRVAIDALPAEERDVVKLSHLAGLTHPEIAERLDIPLGTVKSRSARAHRRLAAALRHLTAPSRAPKPEHRGLEGLEPPREPQRREEQP